MSCRKHIQSAVKQCTTGNKFPLNSVDRVAPYKSTFPAYLHIIIECFFESGKRSKQWQQFKIIYNNIRDSESMMLADRTADCLFLCWN